MAPAPMSDQSVIADSRPPAALAELAFMQWLIDDCGYRDPKPIVNGRYACIRPLLYTHAIIVGTIGDTHSCSDRWCYHDHESAKRALDAWDGLNEPSGWHRHPATGRRRPEGDPAREYVAS